MRLAPGIALAKALAFVVFGVPSPENVDGVFVAPLSKLPVVSGLKPEPVALLLR
jgi:hypothetical protein